MCKIIDVSIIIGWTRAARVEITVVSFGETIFDSMICQHIHIESTDEKPDKPASDMGETVEFGFWMP
jgi:hypothetical protein